MKAITDVARELGISEEFLTVYGRWKAKVDLRALGRRGGKKGKLVLVTAMTPTPFGEGKTVTAIGLSMGLSMLGRKSILCLRQPSLGPTLGLKGGGAGGGRCTVEPMQDINLRFTGDMDAVGAAHNLLAAMVDNHIFHGNTLGIDARNIVWPRVVDMDDRALRQITVALGPKNGIPHDGNFEITAASEIMAVLCLSRDYQELRERLGKMIVAYSSKGEPVTAKDLKAVGAMAALLREAMQPNLVQTAEGTPALIHGGPFGNIAHGTSSLVSIMLGLQLADFCVVEAGFATDLGAEKFVDIAARSAGFEVDAAVLVATVRALRHHGGAGREALDVPDAGAVEMGLQNLAKHIENMRAFGLDPVVALNKFPSDSSEEEEMVRRFCEKTGTDFAVSTSFSDGGAGAKELAGLVLEAVGRGQKSRPIYRLEVSPEDKLKTIVTRIYGGRAVEYTSEAEEDLSFISMQGMSGLPICVAKTPLSLSDDQTKTGRPRDFTVRVQRVRPAAGAGFNVVYMGDIVTMPGLPRDPLAEKIGLSDDGVITGLR